MTLIWPPVVRLPVNPCVVIGVLARLIPKLSLPSMLMSEPAASSTFPWNGEAPEINMPVRPSPSATPPSKKGSSSEFVCEKSSKMEIEPVCVYDPSFPPCNSTPVAPSISSALTSPSNTRALSESRMIPERSESTVTVTPVSTVTSAGVPSSPAVDVRICSDVSSVMVTWACAVKDKAPNNASVAELRRVKVLK